MTKKIVILGGGESGFGSAILAKKQGFDAFLSDKSMIEEYYKGKLHECDVKFEEGGHSDERILSADEIIKSPGIPDSVPIVQAAREKGIPVISEIEFAARYTDARTICITGSNGKTTTTTLTYKILKDAGYNVALGGNIGKSFAYSVATGDFDWYVLELSSFQIDGMSQFRADIAVLMNITPDHLDRYDYNMRNYAASKMGIVRNQRPDDSFIYCADDPVITAQMEGRSLPMRLLPFTVHGKISPGASLRDGEIIAEAAGRTIAMPIADMKIKGIHNIYNTMAASLAALAAGVRPENITDSVREFKGVEHRLERVGMLDGVEYINDSKATNVDSVWYALESMTKPVIWIAGGTDKGNDYSKLFDLAREKVKVLVCMGADNRKLADAFKEVIPVIYDTNSIGGAMQTARDVSKHGDVVVLSPACASFDLFRNYEDRGRQFKQWVKENKKKK